MRLILISSKVFDCCISACLFLFSKMAINSMSLLTCFVFGFITQYNFHQPTPVPLNRDELKRVGDYRKDLKAFVSRTKIKTDATQRIGAIVDLCHLHHQLVSDPRFNANQQLKSFRAIAASRLIKCQREIEVEMKRHQRQLDRISKMETLKKRGERPHSSQVEFPDSTQLEQAFQEMAVEDMQLLTQLSGGPVRVWSHIGGNFGANGICDFGPDLVQLIENTINPDSWQSNGGSGVIHYYRPLRILVISASSQVHDNVTDLLNQIR